MRRTILLMLLVGCGGRGGSTPATSTSVEAGSEAGTTGTESTSAELQTDTETEAGSDAGTEHPVDPTPAAANPDRVGSDVAPVSSRAAELYAECEQRLEQPETQGECSSNADCAPAGCSQEICTTPAAAADMMSMCDMQPCFEVVDTCGCTQGRCRWTLKEPAPMRKLNRPQ